jgi:autophagy-related protein 5
LHAFFGDDLIYPEVDPAEAWLEYEGVPLKWHYPLGLLHDLYSGAEPSHPLEPEERHEHFSDEEERESLPWKLTLHFSKYPVDQLVKLDTDGKHLHDLYIHSVKEVNCCYPPRDSSDMD